jgi:hypothetical protein
MNWKQGLMHGLLSAVISSLVAIIYNEIYSQAFIVDFSTVLNVGGIIFSSTLGCLLMAVSYLIFTRKWGIKAAGFMNIVFIAISFISILGIFGFNLPLDIESPELFPGLAIPMHFFPALGFLAFTPFFSYWRVNK